ncbi:McrB family protein [Haloarcula marina]|uniref:McrB family protein n=1 Tax=Haloarcula marina TaxID=2961574 RepID=UPI0020B791B3|nr:AAA family ATPase [Halomicroarcula marina]
MSGSSSGPRYHPRNLDVYQLGIRQVPSIENINDEIGFEEDKIRLWRRSTERKGQSIFYGPPGTGKTYIARQIALNLAGHPDRVKEIQFHPSYSYEEFIQGIRPKYDTGAGVLKYPPQSGHFVNFCEKAGQESTENFVLFIDEINRAETAAVFGELLYALEDRGLRKVDLPYQTPDGDSIEFSIPENVYIIGTMNTADRSIALVDYALRRRFAMFEILPKYETLEIYHESTGIDVSGLIDVLKEINQKAIGNQDQYLGITYFLRDDLDETLPDIWETEVMPYLKEYFVEDIEQAKQYEWEKVQDDIDIS